MKQTEIDEMRQHMRERGTERAVEAEPMVHALLLAGALAGGSKGRPALDQADAALTHWQSRWIVPSEGVDSDG